MQGIRPNSLQIKNVDFKRIPVLVPDLATQNRIVKFLDEKTAEIDAAIANKRRLIELLEEKRIALITETVTQQIDSDTGKRSVGSKDYRPKIPLD